MLLLATLLAACATPEQRAEQARQEMQQRIRIFGPACRDLGFAEDSDPWRQCILQLSQRETQQLRALQPPMHCVGIRGSYTCFPL
jgi:hypothetical protein